MENQRSVYQTQDMGMLEKKRDAANAKFHSKGIANGVVSGLTFGIYSTLVAVASGYDPLLTAVGVLSAPFVSSGINDLLAGIWLLFYNAKKGRLKELKRTLQTKPGQMLVIGFLLGGPVANGCYLGGIALAGAYAIPISATCNLFAALFAWIFLKQKPTKRVALGMLMCAAGSAIINMAEPAAAPNFTLGIILAFAAAICWGLEGVFSNFGGAMIDTDVAVNLRELISGLVCLIVVVPVIGALHLLGGTLAAVTPVLWLALSGLSAAASFLTWYKANATVGVAIGMSLNVTYAFWGVFFGILFLGQELTATILLGSVVIVLGAITVSMNPLELIRKKGVD